jgi:riboflavin synthase
MFTGIVQEKAHVVSIKTTADIVVLRLAFPKGFVAGILQGASVSVQGCCLTVTGIFDDELTFEVVPEPMSRTAFKKLQEGALVNVERSLKFGDEVGGHILSGHVDTVAAITDIQRFEHSRVVTFEVPVASIKYIFEKGYIAINGASLTVTHVHRNTGSFKVSLIPETLAKTTFGDSGVGDLVNIEIDRTIQAIVETVEMVLAQREGSH